MQIRGGPFASKPEFRGPDKINTEIAETAESR